VTAAAALEPWAIPATIGKVGDVFDMMAVRLRIREVEPTDRAYIATRWITSADVEDKKLLGAVVDRLLDSSRSRLAVVCSDRVPSTVFAWACASVDLFRPSLHYAYVDGKMRGFGVGRAVIRAALEHDPERLDCTHPWPFESERYTYDRTRVGLLLDEGRRPASAPLRLRRPEAPRLRHRTSGGPCRTPRAPSPHRLHPPLAVRVRAVHVRPNTRGLAARARSLIMSDTTSGGYAEGMSREKLPHPTDKIQPGVVVQHVREGTQYKVLAVDPATRLFTRAGGYRTEWFSYDEYMVLDGRTEPLDLNDPDIAINDAERALERLKAQKLANEAIEARAAARTTPGLAKPKGTRDAT
jgi:GNAT superfamily N-acetyltransferase